MHVYVCVCACVFVGLSLRRNKKNIKNKCCSFYLLFFKYWHHPKEADYLLSGRISDFITYLAAMRERRAAVVNSSVFTQCIESSVNISEGLKCVFVCLFLKLCPHLGSAFYKLRHAVKVAVFFFTSSKLLISCWYFSVRPVYIVNHVSKVADTFPDPSCVLANYLCASDAWCSAKNDVNKE